MNLAIVCSIGHNTGAIRSEAPRNGQAKPACGAGYQRSFFRVDQIVPRNAPPNFRPVAEFSCAARRAGRLDNVNVPSGER